MQISLFFDILYNTQIIMCVLRPICTTVTTYILAYSSHAYEKDPIDDLATVFLSIFLVSCPFYVLFWLHLLSSCGEGQAQILLCSSSIRKAYNRETQLAYFNLNCPSCQLQIINSCKSSLQGWKEGTRQFFPDLVEKPQALPLLSVASTQLAFPLLLYCSIKDVWKEARDAKEGASYIQKNVV